MHEQTILYYGKPTSPPLEGDACRPTLVEDASLVPEGCAPVGDYFLGSTGRSWRCGKGRVMRDVAEEMCRMDADVAYVRELHDPHSHCFQVRAVGYRCEAPLASTP
jgi:hypothetical protein